MDSGATETVGSLEAVQSVLSAVQKVMSQSGNRRGRKTNNDVQTG